MNSNLQGDVIAAAIGVLNEERVITYSTEVAFGVGRDPDSGTTVMQLLELKQRPVDRGLILIVANYEQPKPYIDDTMLADVQREVILSRWPGSITFVFPAPATTPRWLTGRSDSPAVWAIDHPLVAALCQAYGKPLVSISINSSGLPPCRIVDEVRVQFGVAFPVVPSETGGCLNPSEVRDALMGELLRQG